MDSLMDSMGTTTTAVRDDFVGTWKVGDSLTYVDMIANPEVADIFRMRAENVDIPDDVAEYIVDCADDDTGYKDIVVFETLASEVVAKDEAQSLVVPGANTSKVPFLEIG
ncbi:hypothetical protein KSP40_PGU004634 [Platanthera guangdongensis]|uniref:Uncharacterized protein n=1 Tax=Platanthera guangdongensis TaxID=2320717 RepID=A0ABR2LMM7_9ASPA